MGVGGVLIFKGNAAEMERKTKTNTSFGRTILLLYFPNFLYEYTSVYKEFLPLLSCYGFQATCFIPKRVSVAIF